MSGASFLDFQKDLTIEPPECTYKPADANVLSECGEWWLTTPNI